MEPQAPEPQTPMPEMEPQDPAPEPEPQMESQDPAREPQPPMPEMEPQDPAPEPQPPMGTRLEIVRFGGAIYSRRGQKRTIAETVSESDDIHRAPSPLPSPLRYPGSSSSQAHNEYVERCRIQDKKTALLFLEDLLKELKRAGLFRFMKEEPIYRRNAESICTLLERLRFEEGRDLKKKFEDIFSLYSQCTKIVSFSCEQNDLTREWNLRELTQKSHDEDRHIFPTISNSLEKLKAKKLKEEKVAKIAQEIIHLKSRINILKDALDAAVRELNCSRDERVPYQTFTA